MNRNIIKLIIILILKIIFKLYNNSSSRTKTVICVIAKKENKYIKEFIEHYIYLGINKILLYDNNDIEGENFDNILISYIIIIFIFLSNDKKE